MSLYNAIFGVNPFAAQLLQLLGLTPDEVGRFRDCHVKSEEGAEPVIVVFTRNGGGNREEYELVTEILQAHPLYIRDYDDDFDCTYASYEFKVPEAAKPLVAFLAGIGAESDPMGRFDKLIRDMQGGAETDDSRRALEVGQQIMGAVAKAFEKPKEDGEAVTP